jgi:hypothetical protein
MLSSQRTSYFVWLLTAIAATAANAEQPPAEKTPTTLGVQQLPMLKYLVRAKLDSAANRLHLVVLVDALRGDAKAKDVLVNEQGVVDFPTGRKPMTIPTNELQLYRLDGQAVPIDEAKSVGTLQTIVGQRLLDHCDE